MQCCICNVASVQNIWSTIIMSSTSDLTYSTFDAKAKLSEILTKVSEGQEVVITRHGRPVAKVIPIPQTGKRELGFGAAEVGFLPGWDIPLTAEDLLVE